jgi:hypothetical protein
LNIIYPVQITPEITAKMYAWSTILAARYDPSSLSSLYDFRAVKDFGSGTITTVRGESSQINQQHDLSRHPVALVVETHLQEQMVRTVMNITSGQKRKKIVRTIEEAHAFFIKFHAEMDSQS